MKANRQQVERALLSPESTRCFLFYGPDEAGSRALAAKLSVSAGPDAERVSLNGADLRADPARLPDEAGAISLFGGARYIVIENAGDEVVSAVEALLEAPGGCSPVAIVAAALKPASKLLKLGLGHPDILVFASYVPEGRDAERMVIELAREEGLQVPSDLARRIADGANGNRAAIQQELAKFAIYLEASPDHPRPVDHETLDVLGAASDEGDLGRLVESVGSGNASLLRSELQRLASEGIEGIPLIRAVLKRMTLLARLRAEVDRGSNPSAVMATQGKAIFWKEKDAVAIQLSRWRADMLAKSISRLLEAERQVKMSGGLGPLAAADELFAICRQAARLR